MESKSVVFKMDYPLIWGPSETQVGIFQFSYKRTVDEGVYKFQCVFQSVVGKYVLISKTGIKPYVMTFFTYPVGESPDKFRMI